MTMTARQFAAAIAIAAIVACGAAGAFSIPWWTVDAGGTTRSSGGTWMLSGTIGQPDATAPAALAGGDWTLTGGFWAVPEETSGGGDAIFKDRFEE